jgi:hypothetical protein
MVSNLGRSKRLRNPVMLSPPDRIWTRYCTGRPASHPIGVPAGTMCRSADCTTFVAREGHCHTFQPQHHVSWYGKLTRHHSLK